jgi:hypothetical protein
MKTKCVSARMYNYIPAPFLRETSITLYFSDIKVCVLWKAKLQGFRKHNFFTKNLTNKILTS